MLRLTEGVEAAAPPAALALGRPRARRSFKPDDSLPADVDDGMMLGVITGASIVPISFKCAAF